MRINGHRALGTVIQQQVGYINQLFQASASVSNINISAVIYLATSADQLPPEIEVSHVVIREFISPCTILYFPSPPFKLLELPIACKRFLIRIKLNISIDSSLYQKVFTVLTNADIVQNIYF